jgi:hypothetical protein
MPHASVLLFGVAAPFQVGRPLFGSVGLALLAVLLGIALLLFGVALLGRWLAATHPEAPTRPAQIVRAEGARHVVSSAPLIGSEVPAEVVPVLLAATAAMFGERARVTSIHRANAKPLTVPSIEALMQQWSHEGRRQIYSSHKVR